jgi:hypothetical protein
MLADELKPAIHGKRRGTLSKGVVLHHDNAWPHTAATTEIILKLKLKFVPHPAYSPDLTHLITIFLYRSNMCYMDAN